MFTPAFYESTEVLAQYLWLHYAAREDVALLNGIAGGVLNFPERCVNELLGALPEGRLRALDVGCAVGRATFELARHCEEVIGLDRVPQFIETAERLRARETVLYALPIEGELMQPFAAWAPDDVDVTRVRFEVGDAANIRRDIGEFDLVFAANLICRMMEPIRFLSRLSDLVKPGGLALLTTPSTWRQIFTPRENWLGGYEGEHGPVRTLDGLRELLEPTFVLERRVDIPFLIREHARKFELVIAEGTAWRKR
ncbi:MAG: putative 4-mercaptohistidine N1-methyltransferase [Kiritimatiellae bacterium]|nr:putative 4-mercaptohistidine N1-methyltransferase [Kiritimatiellia bacterium]